MARLLPNGKIIRRCIKCQITSNIVPFRKQKCSRNGKIYTHNICMPCFEERRSLLRRKNYRKNREDQISNATKWNIDNREKYNKRRRIKNKFFNNCIENFYLTEPV